MHETVGRVYIKEFVTGALHHSDPGDDAIRVDVHPEYAPTVHMRSAGLVGIRRCVYLGEHCQDLGSSRIGNLGTRREEGCCCKSCREEEDGTLTNKPVTSERR